MFHTMGERLASIETLQREIRNNQKTWGHRIWGMCKGAALAVFVWFLSGKLNGKG